MEENVPQPIVSPSGSDDQWGKSDTTQRTSGGGLTVQVPMNRFPSIEQLATVPVASPMDEHAGQEPDSEDRRREALRKAGAQYLDQALAQAAKGDPFQSQDPKQRVKERRRREAREDPEFVAFGKMLRDNVMYAYMALYVLCQASSYVLVKASFQYMQTPAVLTFLHMLAAAGALGLTCHFGVFEKLQLSAASLKGSSMRILLFSSQMLCMFSALHHNSVNVVLVWTTAGGAVIEAAVSALVGSGTWQGGAFFTRKAASALMLGFGAGVLELFFDRDKVAVGLVMLALWSLSKATECVWKELRLDATLGGRLTDPWLLSNLRAVADEEAQLGGSTLSLMQNLVPAVPVLLLGFVCMEGEELVSHELSVPGVKVMLCACGAYALATVAQLLLDDKLTGPSTKLALRGASLLGATILFAVEEHKTISFIAGTLTVVSITSSLLATWRQREAQAGPGFRV